MKATKNTTWNQKLNSVQTLKARIKHIYKDAKQHFYTNDKIIECLNDRVYKTAMYKTLPNYIKSEIKGYANAFSDMHYDALEWVHWYNGKFVGKELPYGKDFDQNKVESAFVYKGTENKFS